MTLSPFLQVGAYRNARRSDEGARALWEGPGRRHSGGELIELTRCASDGLRILRLCIGARLTRARGPAK